jgi:hypothetical protein
VPSTVDEAFATLIGRLAPSTTETAAAASHRGSIEACLKATFGMTSFFRSGSFGHNTSVKGFSDVDYFAVIPTANLKDNSAATLQSVRERLVLRFPTTGVTVRSPAVLAPFGSSPGERHEIVPADYVGSSGGYSVYDIPDRSGGWMRASPTAHNAWVNQTHTKLYSKLKPLIRLVKAWNYHRSVCISSFYLELRTTEYASGESAIVYSIDMLRTLRHLRAKSLAAMQDPMGASGLVYACSEAIKPAALAKLDTAISRAEKARAAEMSGNIQGAFAWRDLVFDGHFPAYY